MDRLTYILGMAIMLNLNHLWVNKIRLKNIQKDIEEIKKIYQELYVSAKRK